MLASAFFALSFLFSGQEWCALSAHYSLEVVIGPFGILLLRVVVCGWAVSFVCFSFRFQVYDGQLRSHPAAANRNLVLLDSDNDDDDAGYGHGGSDNNSDRGLKHQRHRHSSSSLRLVHKSSGVCALPVNHQTVNTHASVEEVEAVVALVQELLDPSKTQLLLQTNQHDEQRPLTIEDILVVSPFNMQVTLPPFPRPSRRNFM